MPFSRLRKGAFCIILNPRLNEKPGTVHLYWQLMACRELCVAMQSRYLEILDFTQFFDHFVFTPNAENVLEKELKKEIPVSVGIELVVVDMSRNG